MGESEVHALSLAWYIHGRVELVGEMLVTRWLQGALCAAEDGRGAGERDPMDKRESGWISSVSSAESCCCPARGAMQINLRHCGT